MPHRETRLIVRRKSGGWGVRQCSLIHAERVGVKCGQESWGQLSCVLCRGLRVKLYEVPSKIATQTSAGWLGLLSAPVFVADGQKYQRRFALYSQKDV